jgi:hypothetical protein
MHIDAKVLRVDAGGCDAGEELRDRRSSAAFPSRAEGLWVPCGPGFVFSTKGATGDKSGGVDMTGGCGACCLRLGALKVRGHGARCLARFI